MKKRAIIIFERPSHAPNFTRLNFHGVKWHILPPISHTATSLPRHCHIPINHNSTVFELFFFKETLKYYINFRTTKIYAKIRNHI